MSTDPRPGPERARVTLAVPDGELRARLVAALEGTDVVVDRLSRCDLASGGLRGADVGDVLVLRRGQVDDEILALLREGEDAPALVVMSEGETAAERAELVAAGAAQVLDAGEASEELSRALEAVIGSLVDAEAIDGATPDPTLADFLSRSPYMRRFLELVRRVADSGASLLVTGETGVGKEHLARAIHAESRRRNGPFVAVNCGAIPESLLASELFGHEAGSFTGARGARAGHFEAAHGGTIFLDEIGEAPPRVQVELLSVLQRRQVRRVGAEEPKDVDVRVIAATNRDVEEEVRAGRLREDLYYRLDVVSLRVPSLRERPEDVPDLVGALIRHLGANLVGTRVSGVSDEAMAALQRYSWPGNVRELVNVVERGMLLAEGHRIGLAELPARIRANPGPTEHGPGSARAAAPPPPHAAARLPADWREIGIKEIRDRAAGQAERLYLDALLTETRGRVDRTAERAGISPRALYDRMRRHGLDKDDYKEESR